MQIVPTRTWSEFCWFHLSFLLTIKPPTLHYQNFLVLNNFAYIHKQYPKIVSFIYFFLILCFYLWLCSFNKMQLKDWTFKWATTAQSTCGWHSYQFQIKYFDLGQVWAGRRDLFLFIIKLARGRSSSFPKDEPFCQLVAIHPSQHHEEWTLWHFIFTITVAASDQTRISSTFFFAGCDFFFWQ